MGGLRTARLQLPASILERPGVRVPSSVDRVGVVGFRSGRLAPFGRSLLTGALRPFEWSGRPKVPHDLRPEAPPRSALSLDTAIEFRR